MGSSSPPQQQANTTVTQRNPITDQFLPAARTGGRQLNEFLQDNGGNRFTGQIAADIDPARTSALDSIIARLRQARGGGAQRVGQQQLQNAEASARGDYLDPATNPFIRQSSRVIEDDLTRNFTQNVAPVLQSEAIQSGAFGGARAARQNQVTADNFGRTVADAQVRNYNGIYSQERASQLNAGQQVGNALGTSNLIDTLLQAAGGERQGLQQESLNQRQLQFNAQNSLPPGLAQALALINGAPAAGTQQTSGLQAPGARGASLLGGITGGLGAFNAAQSFFPAAFAAPASQAAAAGVAGIPGGAATASFAPFLGGPLGIAAGLGGAFLGSRIF